MGGILRGGTSGSGLGMVGAGGTEAGWGGGAQPFAGSAEMGSTSRAC
jgi:hypothetical protein